MTIKHFLPFFLLLGILSNTSLNACVVSTTYCPPNSYDSSTALDFTATTFQYYSNNNPASNPKTISSPFHTSSGGVNQNIANFSLPSTKDYLEADGWRYIKHDFGSTSNTIDHPWFVLYNYTTGILRVFLAVDNLPDQNGEAMITIEWLDNNQTALLDHYSGENFSHAVDDFNNDGNGKIANFFANSRPYWLHADFTMAYDPCSCDTPAKILIKANLIENTDLQFTVEGSLIQELDDHGRANSGGTIDLKKTSKGLSSAFKDGKKGLKLLKDKDVFKNLSGSSPKISDVFNLIGGVGGVVGAAVKIISLFTGSATSQPANTTPIVFRADLEATGSLTQESPYEDIIFANPGGDNSLVDANFIPHDDNIMGIFNLLTPPQITVRTYTQQVFGAQIKHSKFYLDNPLEYVINPRVGINMASPDTRIMMAFDYDKITINGQNRTHYTTEAFDINCIEDYHPYVSGVISNPPAMGVDIANVKAKIIARFRTYSNREVVYIARFKADVTQTSTGGPSSGPAPSWATTSEFPSAECSGYYYPTIGSRVSTVCNGAKYTSRTYFTGSGDTRNVEEDETTVAFDGNPIKEQLAIYPNPSEGNIFTARYTIQEEGRIKISVMDLQGRVIKVVMDENTHFEGTYEVGFELMGTTPGAYLVVQETESGVINQRIIVQ